MRRRGSCRVSPAPGSSGRSPRTGGAGANPGSPVSPPGTAGADSDPAPDRWDFAVADPGAGTPVLTVRVGGLTGYTAKPAGAVESAEKFARTLHHEVLTNFGFEVKPAKTSAAPVPAAAEERLARMR